MSHAFVLCRRALRLCATRATCASSKRVFMSSARAPCVSLCMSSTVFEHRTRMSMRACAWSAHCNAAVGRRHRRQQRKLSFALSLGIKRTLHHLQVQDRNVCGSGAPRVVSSMARRVLWREWACAGGGTWYSHLWACEFGAAVEATRRGSVKSTKIESAPNQGSGAELCAVTRTG